MHEYSDNCHWWLWQHPKIISNATNLLLYQSLWPMTSSGCRASPARTAKAKIILLIIGADSVRRITSCAHTVTSSNGRAFCFHTYVEPRHGMRICILQQSSLQGRLHHVSTFAGHHHEHTENAPASCFSGWQMKPVPMTPTDRRTESILVYIADDFGVRVCCHTASIAIPRRRYTPLMYAYVVQSLHQRYDAWYSSVTTERLFWVAANIQTSQRIACT